MSREKILIVENESIIAKDLEISLKQLDWKVCGIAHSGNEAVEMVPRLKPDLILMDIKLGKGIDGVEAARQISAFSDVPILYLTAFADKETLSRAKITNPCGYIVKPIEERNLQVTIEMGLHNHRVEKQLKEKDKWLEMIVGNLSEGLVVIDSTGTIQLMNPAAEFYTGWKKEAALGSYYPEVLFMVNEYTGEHVGIPFLKTMEEVAAVLLEEDTCLKARDGSVITIDGKCVPVLDEKGNITSVMLVFHDITQRKRLEGQLRQSQKMEAIGAMAGGIAHDFNNILSAILGNTELSLKKIPHNSRVTRHLTQVLTAAKRAKELVKQILTFSRQGKTKKIPLQVGIIIKEVLELLRSSLPPNIHIRQELQASRGLVNADPIQVHQILMNLCTNALHAMKNTGGVLNVRLEEEESSLCLSVSDTGHGMDSETRARIFEPYFTTKNPGEGTGMGLAVVHSIVQNHNGSIEVQSLPGKGSTFKVFLPLLSDHRYKRPPVSEAFPQTRNRILFVDDEQPLVDLGQELLGDFGYNVVGRTNSIKALEDFRQNPHQFDLAVLDYVMPDMNGSELAEKLLEVRPDLPIIFCTGFSETNAVQKAKTLGIKQIVMKPIIGEKLSRVIRKTLDKKSKN